MYTYGGGFQASGVARRELDRRTDLPDRHDEPLSDRARGPEQVKSTGRWSRAASASQDGARKAGGLVAERSAEGVEGQLAERRQLLSSIKSESRIRRPSRRNRPARRTGSGAARDGGAPPSGRERGAVVNPPVYAPPPSKYGESSASCSTWASCVYGRASRRVRLLRLRRTCSPRGARCRITRPQPYGYGAAGGPAARRPRLLRRPRAQRHLHRRQPVHPLAAHGTLVSSISGWYSSTWVGARL
jgi:hypothetical protein